MEYDVSKTRSANIVVENDLEYYSVDDADTDVYDIGRVLEKSKKVDEEDQTDDSADNIVHLPDLIVKYETLKKVLEKQGIEISKKSQTD